ncbi:MAG: hypothetical protein V2A73_20480, partial [Pseudomonadota bacterium]
MLLVAENGTAQQAWDRRSEKQAPRASPPVPGGSRRPRVALAVATQERLVIDGRLTEAGWTGAAV